MALPAYIPSPETGEWMIGPVPIRAYALLILIGMFVGLWMVVSAAICRLTQRSR